MPEQRLAALESWLGHAVGDAIETALAVEEPVGTSPAWLQLLARYDCTPMAVDERQRIATTTDVKPGAPIQELYDVLERIASQGEVEFKAIEYPDDNAAGRRWSRLQLRIGDLRDTTMAAYRKLVVPKKSMFAAAMASAQRGTDTAERYEQASILRCKNCAAPRLNPTHFECDYCGEHFGGGN